MGRFNEFAQRANEVAVSYFNEYSESVAKLQAAEAKKKEYPKRSGFGVTPEYAARSARAEADYESAKNTLNNVTRNISREKRSQLENIRAELETALNNAFAADPAKMDMQTIELLKSGILKPSEYARLMDDAERADNTTMMRIIAQHAEDKAAELERNDPDAARIYRATAYRGRNVNGGAYLEVYDLLLEVYDRCVNNPAMIKHWDRLTSDAIANM